MHFKTPLEGAVFMYGMGFKVFPVVANQKIPAIKEWKTWAETATIQKIRDYGTANQRNNWAVYCGASDLTVVDIDVKNNAQGLENFKAMIKAENQQHTHTLTICTPSGGKHFYYKGAIKSCTPVKGVDIQSKLKYVLAPGSVIDTKEYYISENAPTEIVTTPSWLRRKVDDYSSKERIVIEDGQTLVEGERNKTFMSIAGAMRAKGCDYNVIRAALMELNERTAPPLSEREIENISKTAAQYKAQDVKVALAFSSDDEVQAKDASLLRRVGIPKRDWIMKNRFIGGFISVLIAPGGIGKSTLTLMDAISVRTGTGYTGSPITKKGNVWLYNTEDPTEETERRIIAACTHYELGEETLEGLKYSSSNEKPFIVATNTKDGIKINAGAIDAAVEFIRDNNIVLMIVDPFVRTHECNENNNMEIDKVVHCFQNIATRTGCAVCLVHHTSKGGALANTQTTDPDMYTARGATALINAARIAHVLTPMSEKEALSFNIPASRRRYYFRLDNAKSNLQPPAEHAEWFEKVSVCLENGDYVGTVKTANLTENAVKDERITEISDKRKIAMYLDGILTLSDPNKSKIDLASILEDMRYDDRLEGVLDFAKKSDRQIRLIVMLKEGLIYKKKLFTYEYDASGKSGKKHWIIVRNKNEEGLDLADEALDELIASRNIDFLREDGE